MSDDVSPLTDDTSAERMKRVRRLPYSVWSVCQGGATPLGDYRFATAQQGLEFLRRIEALKPGLRERLFRWLTRFQRYEVRRDEK